jgi:hypothetical protein
MGLKLGSFGLGHSAKAVLPGRMLEVNFGTVAAAHSAGLAVVGIAASEHSASASRIVAEKMDIGGAASIMVPTVSSSAVVERTG